MTTTSDYQPVITKTVFPQSFLSQFNGWLSHTWSAVFEFLVAERSNEPIITQSQDDNGEWFWSIYDPYTGKTFYGMTDYEVMEWLDTRHHR